MNAKSWILAATCLSLMPAVSQARDTTHFLPFDAVVQEALSAGRLDDIADTEKTKSGGSALTEATEVAVRATGPSGPTAVMSATPPGWWRKTAL